MNAFHANIDVNDNKKLFLFQHNNIFKKKKKKLSFLSLRFLIYLAHRQGILILINSQPFLVFYTVFNHIFSLGHLNRETGIAVTHASSIPPYFNVAVPLMNQ
jgi:hypothetical protein